MKMLRKFVLPLVLLQLLYLISLFLMNKHVFTYRFNPEIVKRYLCSQDIPYEPACPRVFLPDGDIHIASSYLYIKGADPTTYNFQHTPFLKYMYGLSIVIFNNPLILEIILGATLITCTYWLGFLLFSSSFVSILASLFLIIDPLFQFLAGQASYELGQATFTLLYVILMIFLKDLFVLQGITLGLFAGTKYYGAAVFFTGIIFIYKVIHKKLKLKHYFLHLIIAFLTFTLLYTKSFINQGFRFNIFFFQLKLAKYWVEHSITNIPLASLVLFISGYYKSWWEPFSIIRANVWSVLWPISLILSTCQGIKLVLKKKITPLLLTSVIPILYLIYLGVQAPFPRYFILILPFSYLILSKTIIDTLKKMSAKIPNLRRR